jgi:hypothetical protein
LRSPQFLDLIGDLIQVAAAAIRDVDLGSFAHFLVRRITDGAAQQRLAAIKCLSALYRDRDMPASFIIDPPFVTAFDQLLTSDDGTVQRSVLRFLEGAVQCAVSRPNAWEPFFVLLLDAGLLDTLSTAELDEQCECLARKLTLSLIACAGRHPTDPTSDWN